MKGEWRDYLIDILESAMEVEVFIAGMSFDDFFAIRRQSTQLYEAWR